MEIKKLTAGIMAAILIPSFTYASDVIAVEDVAKALEIVIVDMKKQKEVAQEKALSLKSLKIEVQAIEEQLSTLKEEKSKVQVSKFKSDVKLDTIENINRTFEVESIRTQKRYGAVDASSLHVRREASLESIVVGGLFRGNIVEIIELKNNFTLTEFGWVSSTYVKPIKGN